jgi:hypothetical protein
MDERKVNLFVVGAMKAGTTSFVDLLSGHPDIYVPPVKEPHYFIDELPSNLYEPSRFFNLDAYLETTFPKPLHITKVDSLDQYQKVYSLKGDQRYLVDGSTAYLHDPGSAFRIHDYNPDSKIIIITREPLSRAFSHYNMDLGIGRVHAGFEDLLLKEIVRYEKGTLPWNTYLGMSFYREPIKRFKDLFEHVLILNFDTLVNEQEKAMGIVAHFLNIDDFVTGNEIKRNVSRELRFQKLFYLMKKSGLKDNFTKIFSDGFRHRIFRIVSKSRTEMPALSEECMNKLDQLFKKESI